MALFIRETFINVDKKAQFGHNDWHETIFENPGSLFKHLQSEYGRGTGMYADIMATGKSRKIGWVFSKRMRYEGARDPKDSYIREVWVEVSTVNPLAAIPPTHIRPHSPWE